LKVLNRRRTGVGLCKTNVKKWIVLKGEKYSDCECDERQTIIHKKIIYRNDNGFKFEVNNKKITIGISG